MLGDTPHINRSIRWGSINTRAGVCTDKAPANRGNIALLIITHPVDIVNIEGQVREHRQHRKHKGLIISSPIKFTARWVKKAHIRRVYLTYLADQSPVPDIVIGPADKRFHFKVFAFFKRSMGRFALPLQPVRFAKAFIVDAVPIHTVTHLPGLLAEVEAKLLYQAGVVIDDPLLIIFVSGTL